MTVNPAGGVLNPGESTTVTVTVSGTGVEPGSHAGMINITAEGAENAPQAIGVAFVVMAPAELSIINPGLAFNFWSGADASGSTPILVTNTGGMPMTWSASDDAFWLTISPSQGTLEPGQSATVEFTANGMEMAAGNYFAIITVSAEGAVNAPQALTSTMVIQDQGEVSLSSTSVDISIYSIGCINTASQTIQVSNVGGSPIGITVTSSETWLSANPGTMNLEGGGSGELSLSVDSATLSMGTHTGSIELLAPSASNPQHTVTVTVTVAEPGELSLNAMGLSFTCTVGEGNPPSQTFQILNSGGSPFVWSASAAAEWMTVTPGDGALLSGQTVTLTVSVNRGELHPGDYSGSISIDAPEACNMIEPVPFPVNFHVIGNPEISVSTTSIELVGALLEDSNPSEYMTITNTGMTPLAWNISNQPSWIQIGGLSSGTLAPGSSDTIMVVGLIHTSGPGSFEGTITVSGENADDRMVTVSMSVEDLPPALAVDMDTITFNLTSGTPTATFTFSVWNAGGGQLTWSVTPPAWLDMYPTAGGPLAAEESVEVTVAITPDTIDAFLEAISGDMIMNTLLEFVVTNVLDPAMEMYNQVVTLFTSLDTSFLYGSFNPDPISDNMGILFGDDFSLLGIDGTYLGMGYSIEAAGERYPTGTYPNFGYHADMTVRGRVAPLIFSTIDNNWLPDLVDAQMRIDLDLEFDADIVIAFDAAGEVIESLSDMIGQIIGENSDGLSIGGISSQDGDTSVNVGEWLNDIIEDYLSPIEAFANDINGQTYSDGFDVDADGPDPSNTYLMSASSEFTIAGIPLYYGIYLDAEVYGNYTFTTVCEIDFTNFLNSVVGLHDVDVAAGGKLVFGMYGGGGWETMGVYDLLMAIPGVGAVLGAVVDAIDWILDWIPGFDFSLEEWLEENLAGDLGEVVVGLQGEAYFKAWGKIQGAIDNVTGTTELDGYLKWEKGSAMEAYTRGIFNIPTGVDIEMCDGRWWTLWIDYPCGLDIEVEEETLWNETWELESGDSGEITIPWFTWNGEN